MKRRGVFTLWFGWGLPPVLAGALAISFTESWPSGAAASTVFLAWPLRLIQRASAPACRPPWGMPWSRRWPMRALLPSRAAAAGYSGPPRMKLQGWSR